jgi:hypothetical protein
MKTVVNCILTSICDGWGITMPQQCDIVRSWLPSVREVFAISSEPVDAANGLKWVASMKKTPLFRESIHNHARMIRGKESLAIMPPTVTLINGFSSVSDFIDNNKLSGVAGWAFGLKTFEYDEIPSAFVTNITVLHHMIPEVGGKILFSGSEWAKWTHEFFSSRLQPNRYISLSGVVCDAFKSQEPIPAPQEPPPPAPEPKPEVKLEPVKPKKWFQKLL